jgi:hypothetical protein
VSDVYGPESPDQDDHAAMLAALEPRLDRRTLARVLGVKQPELDLIAIGHTPAADAGERLRALYAIAGQTEGRLDDPQALLRALGVTPAAGGPLVPLSLLPRLKKFVIAFVVLDALVFGALFVAFALFR